MRPLRLDEIRMSCDKTFADKLILCSTVISAMFSIVDKFVLVSPLFFTIRRVVTQEKLLPGKVDDL